MHRRATAAAAAAARCNGSIRPTNPSRSAAAQQQQRPVKGERRASRSHPSLSQRIPDSRSKDPNSSKRAHCARCTKPPPSACRLSPLQYMRPAAATSQCDIEQANGYVPVVVCSTNTKQGCFLPVGFFLNISDDAGGRPQPRPPHPQFPIEKGFLFFSFLGSSIERNRMGHHTDVGTQDTAGWPLLCCRCCCLSWQRVLRSRSPPLSVVEIGSCFGRYHQGPLHAPPDEQGFFSVSSKETVTVNAALEPKPPSSPLCAPVMTVGRSWQSNNRMAKP